MHRQILKTKHKKINNLELKIVSLLATIEEQERMTDKIELDLNRSESHGNRLLQQIRDHQDTINRLDEAAEFKDSELASSIASGHTTSCQTDRTPVARDTSLGRDPNMPCGRDHEAGGSSTATSEQSNTVLFFTKNVWIKSLRSPLPHTPHVTQKQAQQRALPEQATIFSRRSLPVVIFTQEVITKIWYADSWTRK